MTQQANNKYLARLSSSAIKPVYIVTFEGVTTRFSTLPVKNPLGPTKTYLGDVQGAGIQVTVYEGRASLGNVTFSLLDKNTEITYLIFQYILPNRIVTIKTGFTNMDEVDYIPVFKGRVLDYTLQSDNVSYQIQAVTLLKDERKDIFTAFTKLTGGINAAATTIAVASTVAFPVATAGITYLKIDDEVISYTGKTLTTFTGCLRAQLGTVAASHNIDAELLNLIVLQGAPLTLALQILTSTGLGTNGIYDVLPACAGLGIPLANIDSARFISEQQRWLGGFIFRFEEFEKMTGKTFIEEQSYTFVNAYPTTDNQGRISIKIYSPPLPSAIAQPIDDDTLIGAPTFAGNVLALYFFNEVDLSFNYDFRTQEFDARSLYEDVASQQAYGTPTQPEVKTKTATSRGFRTSVMTQAKIDRWALRFLKRFAFPTPVLNASALFKNRLIEVGDVLPLTSAFVPDLAKGTMGITNLLVEVIQADPNFMEATQRYTLLNTGYAYGRKYAAISPSSKPPVNFPNYLSATPTQRLYAFISKKVNNVTGYMSNGDPGYYITP